MAHVRQVEFHDAACAVHILRVVHDEVGVERQLHGASRVLRQHRTLVGRAARVAVAEVVAFARHNL